MAAAATSPAIRGSGRFTNFCKEHDLGHPK
jgi:hypothetical protein